MGSIERAEQVAKNFNEMDFAGVRASVWSKADKVRVYFNASRGGAVGHFVEVIDGVATLIERRGAPGVVDAINEAMSK